MKLFYDEQTDKIIEKKIYQKLSAAKDIILFGAGRSGDYFCDFLKLNRIEISCFCDNYKSKQNTSRDGKHVYSFEKAIEKYPEAVICITSVYQDEIYQQISEYDKELLNRTYKIQGGMNWETIEKSYESSEYEYISKNIEKFEDSYDLLADETSKSILENILNYRITRDLKYLEKCFQQKKEYFDDDIFERKIKKNLKIFLDGGAFDGDTIRDYIEFMDGTYSKIYCFEADPQCIKLIQNMIDEKQYKNIEIHEKALWSSETTLTFNLSGAGGSSITDNKENVIEVETESIDSLRLDALDFVKFDIEGAEEEALKGMRDTIQRCKPNLAICVYHKQDDLIRLPQLIHSMEPNYRLYLRHYLNTPVDTILYAIIDIAESDSKNIETQHGGGVL